MANGGELTRYDGGFKHEDPNFQNTEGGIPIGSNDVVEQGETRMNDYIYSDRLKVPGKSHTFAHDNVFR